MLNVETERWSAVLQSGFSCRSNYRSPKPKLVATQTNASVGRSPARLKKRFNLRGLGKAAGGDGVCRTQVRPEPWETENWLISIIFIHLAFARSR